MPTRIPLLSALTDFLYPPSCVICGSANLAQNEGAGDPICELCARELVRETGELCGQCGAPLGPGLPAANECRYCKTEKYAFQSVVTLGIYQGLLQDACRRGKSPGSEALLSALAEDLFRLRGDELLSRQIDLVVPVPQHWKTRFSREQNSAEILARTFARKLDVPLARSLLIKHRVTAKQAMLSPTERRQNVKRAFRVSFPRLGSNKRILLVDDVLTTGSTADACARALRKAGSGEIFVAVLARGLG